MKVLQVINDLSSGGAENLLKEYLPFMSRKVDVSVMQLSNQMDVFEDTLQMDDVQFFKLQTNRKNIYNPINIVKLAYHLKKNHYDIVHVHLFPSLYWISLAKILFHIGVPVIVTEHNTHNRRRDFKILSKVERIIYQQYSKVIAISEGVKNNLIEWNDFDKNKVDMIYNGINLKKFSSAKPLEHSEKMKFRMNSKKSILMVARFSRQKDHRTLIDALHVLSDEYTLFLIGEGPLKEDCEKYVESKNLSDRVFFLGFRNDVNRFMKSVDVFVLSSNWEGFGLVAVEAMAAGLPVIASNVGGLSDVIGDCGFLFEKGDSTQLGYMIKGIVEGHFKLPEEKQIFDHISKFSIEKMVDEYIRTYQKVIDGEKDI